MSTSADPVRAERETDTLSAIQRLQDADAAQDRDELRRALAATLGELNRWRNYEAKVYSERTGTRTKHLRAVNTSGELLEGLLLWRDVVDHHPEQLVDLRAYDLVPSDNQFPSDDLFPGANLSIAEYTEAPSRVTVDERDEARREAFRARVAGQPLFPILTECVAFLSRLNA